MIDGTVNTRIIASVTAMIFLRTQLFVSRTGLSRGSMALVLYGRTSQVETRGLELPAQLDVSTALDQGSVYASESIQKVFVAILQEILTNETGGK